MTTNSRHSFRISPDLLKRDFSPGMISRAWVSDITYIRTDEGWLYLTVIIDLGDRKVIGWSLSRTMMAQDTVIPAWRMAIKNRKPRPGMLFHSDRGAQYACDMFRKELAKADGVRQSMSRKANCWDNAVAESFFKTLKVEQIYGMNFPSRRSAKMAIFSFIEIWYNRKRMHQTLGYKTPEEYYKMIKQQALAA